MPTIHGKPVESRPDADFLVRFLGTLDSQALQDGSISRDEALELLDLTRDKFIDTADLAAFVARHPDQKMGAFTQSIRFFRKYEVDLPSSFSSEIPDWQVIASSPEGTGLIPRLIQEEPEAAQALKLLARNKPDALLKRVSDWSSRPYAKELLRDLAFTHQGLLIHSGPLADSALFPDQDFMRRVFKSFARRHPEAFFLHNLHFGKTPYDQEMLGEAIGSLIRLQAPNLVLAYADQIKNHPKGATAIQWAAKQRPALALKHLGSLSDQGYAARILEESLKHIARTEGIRVLDYYDEFKNEPYAREVLAIADRVLKEDSGRNPKSVFKIFNYIHYRSFAADMLAEAVLRAPSEAFLHGTPYRRSVLESRDEPGIQKYLAFEEANIGTNCGMEQDIIFYYFRCQEISKWDKSKMSDAMALLDTAVREDLSLEDLEEFLASPEAFFSELVSIKSIPGHLGDISVDDKLRDISLKLVAGINARHDEPEAIRFASVEGADSLKLYTLMVYAEEEVFTSTFNGLFNRFRQALDREDLDGGEFLRRVNHNKFRTFIKLCAAYNRLDDFLAILPPGRREILLRDFVSNIETAANPLEEAVAIADTLISFNDPEITRILLGHIHAEASRLKATGTRAALLYQVLEEVFAGSAASRQTWAETLAQRYQVALPFLTQAQLFDAQGRQVQRYYFYDDEDGRGSFESFLTHYRDDAGWVLADKGDYVLIRAEPVQGRTLLIYANKPTAPGEKTGASEIDQALKSEGLIPRLIVHRGHSYHAHKTIARIQPDASLVWLGSCGGYRNVAYVLDHSAQAQIISTKGIGKKAINDPLLKALNEEMLAKGEIDWAAFWGAASDRFGHLRDFRDYVPPHRNMGAVFLKIYFKKIEDKEHNARPLAERGIRNQGQLEPKR